MPQVRVTDFAFNRDQTLALWQQADDAGCAVVYFPELGLSAYTAGDLHLDRHLQHGALDSLAFLLREGARLNLRSLAFVGLTPLRPPRPLQRRRGHSRRSRARRGAQGISAQLP